MSLRDINPNTGDAWFPDWSDAVHPAGHEGWAYEDMQDGFHDTRAVFTVGINAEWYKVGEFYREVGTVGEFQFAPLRLTYGDQAEWDEFLDGTGWAWQAFAPVTERVLVHENGRQFPH